MKDNYDKWKENFLNMTELEKLDSIMHAITLNYLGGEEGQLIYMNMVTNVMRYVREQKE